MQKMDFDDNDDEEENEDIGPDNRVPTIMEKPGKWTK